MLDDQDMNTLSHEFVHQANSTMHPRQRKHGKANKKQPAVQRIEPVLKGELKDSEDDNNGGKPIRLSVIISTSILDQLDLRCLSISALLSSHIYSTNILHSHIFKPLPHSRKLLHHQ